MVRGTDSVAALINDLYRRIEQHELLRVAFPNLNSGEATGFFMQWFGGSRTYWDDLAGAARGGTTTASSAPKRPRRG